MIELPGSVRYARDFIDRRRVADGVNRMNRLYVAESTPSCTGAMADHRLRLPPRDILRLARTVAARLNVPLPSEQTSVLDTANQWLAALVDDLQQARGRSLVIAGESEPPLVHVLAHAINQVLGNVGQTVQYIEPVEAEPVDQVQSLAELVDDMQSGRVQMLVMLGGNPIYNTPG